MSPIQIFGFWVASTFGLMWIKSGSQKLLRCNWFTAGIAAALLIPIFTLIILGQYFFAQLLPDSLDYPFVPLFFRFISPRIVIGGALFFLALPMTCCLCIVLCHYLLPGFRAAEGKLLNCAFLFTGVLMVLGLFVGMFQIFGAALLSGVFGVGMRQSDYHSRRNDYY